MYSKESWHIKSPHTSIGTGISENQFGFQTGRSSIDAIDMVTNYDQAAVTQGGVALLLLIDIVNAFNIVP